ncbi:1-phosphofructokinase [Bacillus ectoiniformans]|uniref:1-phosphofructokinase n=1 Tax=Bacillus ectoiniformans TaxID=1494429 RepID=UPI001957F466|nr:1-phosphofructokinase [Bacillus ectoiniformans]MBM7648979.1 1-phosphofructokinase [Bacillus ectoiniformans]
MIYTCTLNPSVDYIVKVEDFQLGSLNRSSETHFYAGGKGINVSRVLNRLGVENTALGFAGGFTGSFIKEALDQEGVTHDFSPIQNETRINVKMKTDAETEINSEGPAITEGEAEQLVQKVAQLHENDVLILAGSIPPSLPKDYYASLMKTAKDRGCKVVLDTSGEALKELLPYKPFVIKPNHHELGELFQTEVTTVEKAVELGKRLVADGIEHVLVSMAGEGALYLNAQSVLHAVPPKGKVKNSVGAGDSMVAGFVSQLAKNAPVETAFLFSLAAGSATAFLDDLCTKEKVEELLQDVQVTILEQGE